MYEWKQAGSLYLNPERLTIAVHLESAKPGEKRVCLWLSDPVHKFDKLRVLASDGQGLELRHLFS